MYMAHNSTIIFGYLCIMNEDLIYASIKNVINMSPLLHTFTKYPTAASLSIFNLFNKFLHQSIPSILRVKCYRLMRQNLSIQLEKTMIVSHSFIL